MAGIGHFPIINDIYTRRNPNILMCLDVFNMPFKHERSLPSADAVWMAGQAIVSTSLILGIKFLIPESQNRRGGPGCLTS